MNVDFRVVLPNTVANKVAVMIQSVYTFIAVSAMVVAIRFCLLANLALFYFFRKADFSLFTYFCNLFNGARIRVRLFSFPENKGEKDQIKRMGRKNGDIIGNEDKPINYKQNNGDDHDIICDYLKKQRYSLLIAI